MNRFYTSMLLFVLMLLPFAFEARADESIKGDHIQISLVAPQQFGAGKTTMGIRYVIDPEWHIYWKNPGDSGSAPKFNVTSETADLGPIQWPAPKRLPVGDLVNLGYDGSVILPFEITPKSGEDKTGFEARIEWLVCDKGECIPGFGTLTLNRPVGATEKWDDTDLAEVRANVARVPQHSSKSSWKITDIQSDATTLTVAVTGSGDLKALDLFPTDGKTLRPQPPTKTVKNDTATFAIAIQPSQKAARNPGFILVEGNQAWEWNAPAPTPLTKPSAAAAVDFMSLLILFFSSFIGGVILNFMPCVLPVLSIKFLSISQTPPAQRAKDSLLYTAGVLVTFSVLGGIFLGLRSAGASVGWGFQLQSPPVVLALVVLFWLMALNFLGVFEFGDSIMNAAGNSKYSGAFATGILSVFVAAPCTGPFMGTALGAAATLPALQSLAIFIFLGLGLASPFVLVAFSPQLRRIIPRPGAWMEKLKQFFAFPLIATVIWLLWVLHLQVGTDALPWSLGTLLALSFVMWWRKNFRRGHWVMWALAVLMVIYVGVDFNRRANETPAVAAARDGLWDSFSPAKVEEARNQGKHVLIDFTAAWCITCQYNKKTVLRTKPIEALFQDKNVALFEADWTKQDPVITEALSKLGRNSVPVYVFYPAGQNDAKILPQILTPSVIEGLFQ